MTIAVRVLGPADEAALRELMDAVVPGWVEHRREARSGPAAFLADAATFALGAYDGELPVGWAWAVHIGYPNGRRVAYLHELDVVESHRRRGIATRLVGAAMDVAERAGCSKLWLSTGGHNAGAQALYDSLGGDRKPLGDVNYWWDLT